jgi:hypothetical protein
MTDWVDPRTPEAPLIKRARETKAHYAARVEAYHSLREVVKPGDTIYTILRHVSSSGMYRAIDLFAIPCEDGRPHQYWLSHWAAKVMGDRFDERRNAIGVYGAGMDMGSHLVYNLAETLFWEPWECVGDRCPHNIHTNDWSSPRGAGVMHPGTGYALRHEWL